LQHGLHASVQIAGAYWLSVPLCSFCTTSVTRPCDPAGSTAQRAAAAAAAFSAAIGLVPSRLLATALQTASAAQSAVHVLNDHWKYQQLIRFNCTLS